jgi:hypothetical protein
VSIIRAATRHNPLTDAEVEAKFHFPCGPVLGADRATALCRRIREVDELDDSKKFSPPIKVR